MNIGIIDSGSGGLAFAKNVYEKDLTNNYYVLLDRSFFPYGRKTKSELTDRVNYLISQFEVKIDKLIIACNTLSIMVDKKDINFNNEIIDVVSITNKYLESCDYQNILVIGTYNTILHNPYKNSVGIVAEELITAIQNGDYLKQFFSLCLKIDKKYDAIILGCTHFIEIKQLFRSVFLCDIISQDEIYYNTRTNTLKLAEI